MGQFFKIAVIIIGLVFSSCGGGGGSSSSPLTGSGDAGDTGLEDLGEIMNDSLPGTVFYFTETEDGYYSAALQLGIGIIVEDSKTASGKYTVENNMQFETEVE